ncbi:DNA methylase [archaeon]|nr:DNA methylase [archaeon]
MSIRTKKELAIFLSKLQSFEKPSFALEQYETPSEIAATWIWDMAMKSEVAGKTILDAASGPGILGIGLLLLGARKIYFVDKDPDVMQTCIENYNNVKKEYEIGDAEFITEDISLFDEQVDVVVQNPPFGTKEKHVDKKFLETAFRSSNIVYSMHKYSTKKFVEAVSRDHNFKIVENWRFEFGIKKKFSHHTKPVKYIDVGLWKMVRVQ